jgi:hypothetical protein
MEVAVEAAPAVWEVLKEIVENLSEGAEDIRNTLLKAKSTTERLRSSISAMRCGAGADRKGLREDAHVFVKVIHLPPLICLFLAAMPYGSLLAFLYRFLQ